MRTSRRPGGVPDQVETDAIAAAVAEAIWTYDGEPWTTMAIGGSCGAATCLLEVAGTGSGAAGEDLWVFEVTPSTGAVTVTTAELRSLPDELIGELDELMRNEILSPANFSPEWALTTVRWLPPPDDGRFVLSYRSGGEEGSCRADFTIHAPTARLHSELIESC